jgi:protein involved in polysaccharide export with SLBB domain
VSERDEEKATLKALEALTDATPPPNITSNPGDLLMVLDFAIRHLDGIRNTRPSDRIAVLASAKATKIALDTWIALAEKEIAGEAPN